MNIYLFFMTSKKGNSISYEPTVYSISSSYFNIYANIAKGIVINFEVSPVKPVFRIWRSTDIKNEFFTGSDILHKQLMNFVTVLTELHSTG